MKRIRIVGLCGVVALALVAISAMGASSAFAGEQGQCQLLTKSSTPKAKKGNYTDPNCQIVAEKKGKPSHKGNYEWFPGPSPTCVFVGKKGQWNNSACTEPPAKAGKGTYDKECATNCSDFTDSSGSAVLETPAVAGKVTATSSKGTGVVTGAKTSKVVTTFFGVEFKGKKCESTAPASHAVGVVITDELNMRIIDNPEVVPYISEAKVNAYLVSQVESTEPYEAQFDTDFFEFTHAEITEAEFDVDVGTLAVEYDYANSAAVTAYIAAHPSQFFLVAGPAAGKVWEEFSPTVGTETAHFDCEGVIIRTTGNLSGEVTSGVNVAGPTTTSFSTAADLAPTPTGASNLESEESTNNEVSWSPPGISYENLVSVGKSEDSTSEIKN